MRKRKLCFEDGMLKQEGASLPEVVIVLVLAMLLAAVIIPRVLNSKVAANEASAVGNVDVITMAQESYKSAYPHLGYAASLSDLAPPSCAKKPCVPTPQHACLIDCALPAATSASKDGYFYNLSPGNDLVTLPRKSYVVAATAATLAKTGNHNYCAVEDRRIRYSQPQQATPVRSINWSNCRALPVMP